jgi:hypothetical protein
MSGALQSDFQRKQTGRIDAVIIGDQNTERRERFGG